MGKGSHRRPSDLTEAEMQAKWDEAFGPRPLPNVMSDEDREGLARELEEDDDAQDVQPPGGQGRQA
jgi:hypothetical protein